MKTLSHLMFHYCLLLSNRLHEVEILLSLFYFKKLDPNLSLGNVGENLKNKANVYFSKDAGLSWKKVNLSLCHS